MPRLRLEWGSPTQTLDLEALIDKAAGGVQALAGLTGLGLPPVSVQWAEGVGDGARYRGRRVLPRPIDLPLALYGVNRAALKAKARTLSLALAGEAVLRLIEDDGTSWVSTVARTGGGDFAYGTDTDGRTYAKTVVTLQAGSPFWVSSEVTAQTFQGSTNVPTSAVITNPGTADAYPVWTIAGPGRDWSVTSPKGEVLRYQDYVPQGSTITIDTAQGTVVDQNGVNRYAGLAPAPRFFSLPPGPSTVTIAYDRSSSLFLAAQSAGRRNYVTNPLFTSGIAGYTSGTWTAPQTGGPSGTSWAWVSGSQTVAAAALSSGGANNTARDNTRLYTDVTGLTPGQTYQVRASVQSTYDPNSATPPPNVAGFTQLTPASQFLPMVSVHDTTGTYTAPIASATFDYGATAQVAFSFVATAATHRLVFSPGGTAWRVVGAMQFAAVKTSPMVVDNVFLGEPGSFFSGATPGTSQFAYAWTGTANASQSKETPVPDLTKTAVGYSFNAREWMVI